MKLRSVILLNLLAFSGMVSKVYADEGKKCVAKGGTYEKINDKWVCHCTKEGIYLTTQDGETICSKAKGTNALIAIIKK